MHITTLTPVGDSAGVMLPPEVLEEAALKPGDAVAITVRDGRIEIAKADEGYDQAMEVGRRFTARYRRTMAILST